MKKTKAIAVALLAFIQLSFLPANHHYSGMLETNLQSVPKAVFQQRLHSSLRNLTIDDDNAVQQQINRLLSSRKRDSEILLGRAPMYLPMVEHYLRAYNLPQELKYLPVIESALNPKAVSQRGAVGLWQFMPATARTYGLRITDLIDERRDPVKSTQAALQYLADLYDLYGDWNLAIAAYNCGTPRMNKAIRLSGSKNFWALRPYLPRETQRYVPRLLAASYIMNNYQFHDITPDYPEFGMINTRTITVHDGAKLSQIASLTKVSLRILRKLNPAYSRGVVPPSLEGNSIVLPGKVGA